MAIARVATRFLRRMGTSESVMKGVVVSEHGGVDKMVLKNVPKPVAGPNECIISVAFAGVNYIDTYQRSGVYPMKVPFVLGTEGSGVIQTSPLDASIQHGDRVAFLMPMGRVGAYAESVAVPIDHVVPVDKDIGLDVAASVLVQGITAHSLTHSVHHVHNITKVLIHAAAGGTGRLLAQMCKIMGATVYGTCSPSKMEVARQAGVDVVLDYESFKKDVLELTNGRGVDIVYDGVGAATFDDSLECVRSRGKMVAFGNASGVIPPVDPLRLMRAGSVSLHRPRMYDYIDSPEKFWERSKDIMHWIQQGELKVEIGAVFDMDHAAEAHLALEGRETVGKLLMRI